MVLARSPRQLTPEQKHEFAVELGFDRKACNALLATGLCPDHLNTAAALRILRPTQPTPDVAFDDLLKVLRIWLARHFGSCLLTLPRGHVACECSTFGLRSSRGWGKADDCRRGNYDGPR